MAIESNTGVQVREAKPCPRHPGKGLVFDWASNAHMPQDTTQFKVETPWKCGEEGCDHRTTHVRPANLTDE